MTAPAIDDCKAALTAFDTSTIISAIQTFGVGLENEGFPAGLVQRCRIPLAGPLVERARASARKLVELHDFPDDSIAHLEAVLSGNHAVSPIVVDAVHL